MTVTVHQVKIYGSSRPCDDQTAEVHRFTVECSDHADGLAEAEASLPEGWIRTQLQVDRD